MLMAVAPVPPLVPGKELKLGGSRHYAYGVYFAMAVLTLISVPLVFTAASALFGRNDEVPMTKLVMTVATGVILPLLIGLVIRRVAPGFADRAAPLVYKLSMLLVLIAFVPILIAIWPAIAVLVGNGSLAAMAATTVICIAAGHWLGGPERANRAVLAVAASVRHPGIAISLAGANFIGREVQAAVLMYLLVGLVVGAIYGLWLKRSAPAEDVPAAP
jgi:BASS family bile acid:Na+ symporter